MGHLMFGKAKRPLMAFVMVRRIPQALAAFEVLDDLRDLVVDGYARKI